jgi:hypothetical protein
MTQSPSSPSPHLDGRRQEFGRTVLGPILFVAVHRLRLHLHALHQQAPNGAALFCARGGLRLRLLYDRSCAALGVESPWPATDYFISRIAAIRGCLAADFPTARGLLVQGMHDATERELLTTLLAGSTAHADDFLPAARGAPDIPCDTGRLLDRLHAGSHPASAAVMAHARDQHALIRSYTDSVLGDARAAVLCDSGLRCTAQIVLSRLFPERDWHGLLLGCLRRGVAADHYPQLHGLLFDIQLHRDQSRRSTFIRHWEFFERVLEPAIPTTSFYVADEANPARALPDVCRSHPAPAVTEGNPFFTGILDYFATVGPETVTSREDRLYAAYEAALTKLDRTLAFPSAHDVELLNIADHDVGFGLSRTLSSTTRSAASRGLVGRLARVQAAAWPHGQARIEFGPLAAPVQLLLYRPRFVIRAGELVGRALHVARRGLSRITAAGKRAVAWTLATP